MAQDSTEHVLEEIEMGKAYSIRRLAEKFNESERWVKDYFIRPRDRSTGKRRIDPRTGKPMTGVRVLKCGRHLLVTSEAIIHWLEKYSDCLTDDA